MTGNEVVVDSNVLIDLMKGDVDTTTKFQSFVHIFITPVILSELYFGAYRSANPSKNVAKIKAAIQQCSILSINEATAENFVTIKLELQAKGKPIPENDIWIAAAVRQHQLGIYTKDAHFRYIDGLRFV